jgi:glycosyltransferase involved in cell wall biosynthesis
MHIGIIGDSPLITHSVAVVCSQFAKQFIKLGHKVSYLGYNFTGEKHEHPDGYTIYPDTIPPTREASVTEFIKKTGVEILYAHGSKDIFGEGMKAAKKAGIPYVPHTFYSTPVKNDKVNTFEARKGFILYDCDKVDDMAVCNNFSVGVGFSLGKRTWFIPNGVDTDIFYPNQEGYCNFETRNKMGIPNDAFVFLFSGSNISGKDPGRTLDAFARFVQRQNLRSDYPYKNDAYLAMHTRPTNSHLDLKQIAKDKGVSERVKFFTDYFPEWLEQPEADAKYNKGSFSPPYTTTSYDLMPSVFRTGDVQLAPTLMEGMSTTILEGMACGLPTICNDDPVVSEPVVNFSTGLLCRRLLTNECKTEDMIKHMQFFYDNKKIARQMGRNASNLVEVKYNWEIIAKQLLYLFQLKIDNYYG